MVEGVDEYRELGAAASGRPPGRLLGQGRDPKAATMVLKVSEMRVRLLGLENFPKDTDPQSNIILVRGDTSEHFIADLTAVIDAA